MVTLVESALQASFAFVYKCMLKVEGCIKESCPGYVIHAGGLYLPCRRSTVALVQLFDTSTPKSWCGPCRIDSIRLCWRAAWNVEQRTGLIRTVEMPAAMKR